jgi:hypothetical protein
MGSSDPTVEFSYRLTGAGWSEARFAIGDRWVALGASYLTDALGDLLGAVRSLAEGGEDARVSWALEPGEFRWLFTRVGSMVDVRVLSFDADYYDYPADDAGKLAVAGRVRLDALASALATAARAVLDEHGESGYRERWVEHPFPTAALEALEAHSAS